MGASIATAFEIEDRVSKKLAGMTDATKKFEESLGEVGKTAQGTSRKVKQFSGNTEQMIKNFAKGTFAILALKKAIDGLVFFGKFSEEMALLDSRLQIATDKSMSLSQTQDLIMQSAKQTRADYTVLADTVGRIGINASDAFKDTKEVIKFSAALNQAFLIGGASAEEIAGSTRQLTQALASGVLRGDELNSVMEGAPLVIDAITKKLGVTKGEIRDMAADGKLSAQIVKEAVLENADEINKKAQQINGTLGGTIKNGLKNAFIEAFREPAAALNYLFNSEAFAKVMNGVIPLIYGFSDALTFSINIASAGLDFLADHWESMGLVIKFVGGSIITGLGLIGLASIKAAAKSAIAWGLANWPFFLIGASIMGLIFLLGKAGITFEDVAGIAGGSFSAIGAVGKNVALGLAKVWAFFFQGTIKKLKFLLWLSEKVASAVSGKNVRFEIAHKALDSGDNFAQKIKDTKFYSVGDAYESGKTKGQSLWKSLKSFKNPMEQKLGTATFGKGLNGDLLGEERNKKLDKIKEHTHDIKNTLSEGIEHLNFLTKSALSQRVTLINNHNKLEVKNEFNNPDSSFDIDGLGATLGNSLLEAINSGSGGELDLA